MTVQMVAPVMPAEYIEIDDPVYGSYALSWYCCQCLDELGADLTDRAGEVPGCPRCGTAEHLAWCEWGDIVDEGTGYPVKPGPLAEVVFGSAVTGRRTHVGMSTIDAVGNAHHPAGTSEAGQFARKANSHPKAPLDVGQPSLPDRYCSQHGGEWGTSGSCTNCADLYGRPLDYPFPVLRDGLLPHLVDLNLQWLANDEGPSVANPSGGVWHVTAYPIRIDADGLGDTDMNESIVHVVSGRPPKDLEPMVGDDAWWSMDTAPVWLRDVAIQSLQQMSPADHAAAAAIAAAERADREFLEATGDSRHRAAND